jgi:hypothetical protein
MKTSPAVMQRTVRTSHRKNNSGGSSHTQEESEGDTALESLTPVSGAWPSPTASDLSVSAQALSLSLETCKSKTIQQGQASTVSAMDAAEPIDYGPSRHVRRSNSDEIPRMVLGRMEGMAAAQEHQQHHLYHQNHHNNHHHPAQFQYPIHPAPPGYYPSSSANQYAAAAAAGYGPYSSSWSASFSNPKHQGAPYKTSPPSQTAPPRHTRTWSDGGGGIGGAVALNGLPPVYHHYHPYPPPPPPPLTHPKDESQPLLQRRSNDIPKQQHRSGTTAAAHPRRSRGTARQHRRAHSSSAAVPDAYGSFWQAPGSGDGGGEEEDQDTVHSLPSSKAVRFSPRGEIMSFTSNLRSSASSRENSPNSLKLSSRKNYPSPSSSSSINKHISWSPPMANMPFAPPLTPKGVFFGSPQQQQHSQQHHTNRPTNRRSESARKLHIHQQSTQLWIEDVKGTEQSPSCRHVFFLLLFMFHLIFIGYLGNLYGKEALLKHSAAFNNTTAMAVSTTGADWNITEAARNVTTMEHHHGRHPLSTEHVTINYNSLLYIGFLVGPFAVVLSSLLLGIMTLFARHFIKVALMTALILSFIWGTAGIGLSPKSFVPVTGIIALALTVAYTFIVWDRIPFAGANLLTALSGVKAFPGTIVIAFCFQALALAWSLYFSVVVIGVYDSINSGKLPVPYNWNVLVYCLLGLSFYWTFQVLQVSSRNHSLPLLGDSRYRGQSHKSDFLRTQCKWRQLR